MWDSPCLPFGEGESWVLLMFLFPPSVFVECREERVGVCRLFLHEGEVQSGGKGQCSAVDRCASHDKDSLVLRAMLQSLLERGIDLAVGQTGEGAAQHDVASAGQGPVGQRRIGLAAHEDGVSPRERFEAGEILRDMPGQRAVRPYGTLG